MVVVMDNFVYVGKIVGTHGIKGEVKIISDSDIKDQVFIPNFNIYLNKEKLLKIASFRHHKIYDMVILNGYNNINEVLDFVGMKVYVKREDLNIKDYILTDLIGLDVIWNNQKVGYVRDVISNKNNILLEIKGEKHFYIPKCADYLKKVDLTNKQIIVQDIGGLMI